MCLAQFLQSNDWTPVIAAFITLAALGFSIFGAIYSNLTHNVRMADGNARQSTGEAKSYWRESLAIFKEQAKRRAYSASLFCWSLFLSIVTLILYQVGEPDFTNAVINVFCVVTFAVAVLLFGVALKIVVFKLDRLVEFFGRCRCPIRCLVRWPVNPDYLIDC
jgi:hypothetical protein